MVKAGSELRLDGGGRPLWLVLELTYKCPLQCPWCSNPLDFAEITDELTTEEWKRVLREARELGTIQLGFSGGEPMVRKDLEELVAEAVKLGFYTNLITSGMGLTPERLAELKRIGLQQIQLSFQHSDPQINDAMVGVASFDAKMAVAEDIKSKGFPVVMNIPVSRYNVDDVDGLIALAEKLRFEYVEFASLQYYNWALLNRGELLPIREQLETAEAKVIKHRERLGKDMTIYFVVPDYFDGRPKACMNGWGTIHFTIAPDGKSLPCQEARVIKGLEFPNVRDHPLEWIWKHSPEFMKYRGDSWMKEPCVSCDEKETDFGGCRCQAYLLTGDAASTDPACSKSEHFHIIQSAVAAAEAKQPPQMPLVMRTKGSVSHRFKE